MFKYFFFEYFHILRLAALPFFILFSTAAAFCVVFIWLASVGSIKRALYFLLGAVFCLVCHIVISAVGLFPNPVLPGRTYEDFEGSFGCLAYPYAFLIETAALFCEMLVMSVFVVIWAPKMRLVILRVRILAVVLSLSFVFASEAIRYSLRFSLNVLPLLIDGTIR